MGPSTRDLQLIASGGAGLNRAINGYCRLLKLVMATMLAVMVVLVFANVVLRYGFNKRLAISDKGSR